MHKKNLRGNYILNNIVWGCSKLNSRVLDVTNYTKPCSFKKINKLNLEAKRETRGQLKG